MSNPDTDARTLVSLADFKLYLKATNTTYDATLARLADAITSRFETYTGRYFMEKEIDEEISDARGRSRLRLRYFPILEVTELKTRASLSAGWETFDATEYEIREETGEIFLIDRAFYSGARTTSCSYSAGLADDRTDLPANLVQLQLDWSKFLYDRWDKNGLFTMNQSSPGGGITIPSGLPKDIRDSLDMYKRIRT